LVQQVCRLTGRFPERLAVRFRAGFDAGVAF
jgi:hypothetical protein